MERLGRLTVFPGGLVGHRGIEVHVIGVELLAWLHFAHLDAVDPPFDRSPGIVPGPDVGQHVVASGPHGRIEAHLVVAVLAAGVVIPRHVVAVDIDDHVALGRAVVVEVLVQTQRTSRTRDGNGR